jgi:hypothetical protein
MDKDIKEMFGLALLAGFGGYSLYLGQVELASVALGAIAGYLVPKVAVTSEA